MQAQLNFPWGLLARRGCPLVRQRLWRARAGTGPDRSGATTSPQGICIGVNGSAKPISSLARARTELFTGCVTTTDTVPANAQGLNQSPSNAPCEVLWGEERATLLAGLPGPRAARGAGHALRHLALPCAHVSAPSRQAGRSNVSQSIGMVSLSLFNTLAVGGCPLAPGKKQLLSGCFHLILNHSRNPPLAVSQPPPPSRKKKSCFVSKRDTNLPFIQIQGEANKNIYTILTILHSPGFLWCPDCSRSPSSIAPAPWRKSQAAAALLPTSISHCPRAHFPGLAVPVPPCSTACKEPRLSNSQKPCTSAGAGLGNVFVRSSGWAGAIKRTAR